MAILALEPTLFQLPARSRSKQTSADVLSARLALAERISELPDIETVEDAEATVPWSVDVYVKVPTRSLRKRQPPVLFCRIGRDGVGVYGLGNSDRHQALSRGWGKLARDSVTLHFPRDVTELDVCWDLLQRAYRSLIQSSAQSSPRRSVAWAGDLPSFSRTTLC